MRDAFGEDLSLGDRVFCIVGFGSSQTLYVGIVEEFVGNRVRVLIERVPDIPESIVTEDSRGSRETCLRSS